MSYLERRAARLAFESLKKEIIFGMVISSLLLGIGTWRYFVVVGANDWPGGCHGHSRARSVGW